MKKIVLSICFALVFIACKDDDRDPVVSTELTPTVKGSRLLGIDLLDLTETGSFDDNIALANELGVDFIALHLNWTSIETSPNTYEDPGDALFLLNQVAVANGYKFSLTIRPIDLTGKSVPSDLSSTRFNDSLMTSRFKLLIDFIFTNVPTSTFLNIQIGNEIDGYNTFNEPATFWQDYGEFLNEMTNYIHSKSANIKVGFTGTLYGLNRDLQTFGLLSSNVDVIGVTYYPINSNFSVQDPAVIFGDFEELLLKYSDKPIYLQEIGYQTSSLNGSSQSQQVQFYNNFFSVWDRYNSIIKTANIVRLNDISLVQAQASAVPYGISDTTFIEYLRTLGLQTHDGTGAKKQAFESIKEELKLRGW